MILLQELKWLSSDGPQCTDFNVKLRKIFGKYPNRHSGYGSQLSCLNPTLSPTLKPPAWPLSAGANAEKMMELKPAVSFSLYTNKTLFVMYRDLTSKDVICSEIRFCIWRRSAVIQTCAESCCSM